MTCFQPLRGYRTSGGGSLVFNHNHPNIVESLTLPCGQCIGCRLERSRQWAIRCVHEASLYSDNCFITLTYDDDNLPNSGSLSVRHFQLFMKRLRKRFGSNIRFFHCGEYGETTFRPHYHACLFNFDFPDKVLFSVRDDISLYTSDILTEIWGMGHCLIGDVTFQSAAYVARYIMKKVTGKAAADYYERYCPITGEVFNLQPEYTTMSRRPGIGAGWFDAYRSDVYPHDRVIINGMEVKPPKFYDRRYEIVDPVDFELIKQRRHEASLKNSDDQTRERLTVREECKRLSIERLVRNL